MNKNEFILHLTPFDKTAAARLHDKLSLTQKSGAAAYTGEFYPPNVWTKVQDLSTKLGVGVSAYGIFPEAERRIIVFHEAEIYYYPVRLMVIENKSKFSSLEHKDYLGALMSLGIKREKMGDLVLHEQRCYGAVYEDVFDYIKDNLQTVGRSPCSISEVTNLQEMPTANLEDKVVVATSYRLDSVISAISGLSRAKAVEVISSGKVLLNYVEALEKDKIVHNGMVITIRGYGKYRLEESIGNSGSGRLKLLIKKYI
jgi:RNA-binding protein YlmH